MGRLERNLKKKVKNTKKDYSEWYSEHEQQILQRVDENNSEIDLGSVKVKRRVPVKVFILGGAVILLAAIITMSVLLSKTDSEVPEIPDFTFSEEEVTEVDMDDEDLESVLNQYSHLSKLTAVTGRQLIYNKDNSVVMYNLNGELETVNDFYFVNVRVSYADNFIFIDKVEFEDLQNQTVINGTDIEYEAKGTDDYGMKLYYAVTKTEDTTLYWSVSCIEGLFDEWLQIVFA